MCSQNYIILKIIFFFWKHEHCQPFDWVVLFALVFLAFHRRCAPFCGAVSNLARFTCIDDLVAPACGGAQSVRNVIVSRLSSPGGAMTEVTFISFDRKLRRACSA